MYIVSDSASPLIISLLSSNHRVASSVASSISTGLHPAPFHHQNAEAFTKTPFLAHSSYQNRTASDKTFICTIYFPIGSSINFQAPLKIKEIRVYLKTVKKKNDIIILFITERSLSLKHTIFKIYSCIGGLGIRVNVVRYSKCSFPSEKKLKEILLCVKWTGSNITV